ncbi:hypothetical protein cypCar_00040308 [Cyprinus carpio]|nr:hypothetical protein cypCar_00040308 [Cyprinus carpio]
MTRENSNWQTLVWPEQNLSQQKPIRMRL